MSLRFKVEKVDLLKLSITNLQSKGWKVEKTEWYDRSTKRSHDLFGILDAVALRDEMTVGLQVTSKSNIAARVRKIRANEFYPHLCRAGWLIVVHGWEKVNPIKYELTERVVDGIDL